MTKDQGIGARVPRKEDARLLRGRGRYVSDIILPGQSEVAFLRSPAAHATLRGIAKPRGLHAAVFTNADLTSVQPIAAPCTVPSYKVSVQHPLARDKVRYAGELIAMTVAPTRAEAEDLAEQIELDLDELPPLVDAHAARFATDVRVHEEWQDNLFLTLDYNSGFDEQVSNATVVVEREVTMARQAMVPLEGKAIVADWDFQADQLVVYTSTQVPHVIRIGLAECLGIEEGRIRVIAPDVGGGFGYKCVLQPEEICVAWLALTFKRPFRYI
jgi:carbon-monoxide dehydrogenase large subunit